MNICMYVCVCMPRGHPGLYLWVPSVTSTPLPLLVYSLLQLQAPSLYQSCFTSKHLTSLDNLLASALSTFYILLASVLRTQTLLISSLLHVQAPSVYPPFSVLSTQLISSLLHVQASSYCPLIRSPQPVQILLASVTNT